MTIWHALILGIVEGLSEFLPISSTGHLILAAKFLGLEQTEFLKTFEIAIQLGAIAAVVVLYYKKILLHKEIILKVAAAFVPTAVLGLLCYKTIKTYFLGDPLIVVWALLLGGVLLIALEIILKNRAPAVESILNISYTTAVLIGLFQALAFVPGVSRAAATVMGGLLLGLRRDTIVEFSFLLAIPTMAAATGLDLIKNGDLITTESLGFLAVGFTSAFFVAIFSIKFLLHFIKNNNFIPFGIYRIVVAVLFLLICAKP